MALTWFFGSDRTEVLLVWLDGNTIFTGGISGGPVEHYDVVSPETVVCSTQEG